MHFQIMKRSFSVCQGDSPKPRPIVVAKHSHSLDQIKSWQVENPFCDEYAAKFNHSSMKCAVSSRLVYHQIGL